MEEGVSDIMSPLGAARQTLCLRKVNARISRLMPVSVDPLEPRFVPGAIYCGRQQEYSFESKAFCQPRGGTFTLVSSDCGRRAGSLHTPRYALHCAEKTTSSRRGFSPSMMMEPFCNHRRRSWALAAFGKFRLDTGDKRQGVQEVAFMGPGVWRL